MTQPIVVVDTDPGTDDALALMMLLRAHKAKVINIVAITCVSGNTNVDYAARNALRVLETEKQLNIPVHKGAKEPLIIEPIPKDKPISAVNFFHGEDGFGDAVFESEPDTGLIQKEPAFLVLSELARKYSGQLIVMCLGPLTNIALAMKSDPQFAKNVAHFYIMGGNFTAKGNLTATAEFNFHYDPEAAHILLASSCSITMVPWETCFDLGISFEWRHKVLGQAGTAAADLLNKIEEKIEKDAIYSTYLPCDAAISAVMLKPEVVTSMKKCHLTVELHGGRTRGQVVLDHLGQYENNVRLVEKMSIELYKQLLLFAVGHPDSIVEF